MSNVALVEGGLETPRGPCCGQVTRSGDHLRLAGVVENVIEYAVRCESRLGAAPFGVDLGQGGGREVRLAVQHRNQVVLLDHRDPGQLLRGRRVHAEQARSVHRWAQEAGVEHAGKPDVGGILRCASDLDRAVEAPGRLAHDGKFRRRPQHRRVVHGLGNSDVLGEVCVGDASLRLALYGGDASGQHEPVLGDAQTGGGQAAQNRAGPGGGGSQGGAEHAGGH